MRTPESPVPVPVPPAMSPWRSGGMLGLASGFLLLIGLLLPHGDHAEGFRETLRQHPGFGWTLVGLWGAIVLESLAGLFSASDSWTARVRRLALIALVPPLRMTVATGVADGWLWISGAGWRRSGAETTEKLEQKLAVPMLLVTLLVLPVLGAEFAAGDALEKHPSLALAVHFTTCLIWVAFTAEFIWMLSATPAKLAYCQKHWINLVIILLPLVAFLRVLNLFRFTRLLRAGKLLRAYRLRTLQSRLWRLALLFNLLERLQQRNPEKYCAGLEKKIGEMEAEAARLRGKLERFRALAKE